MIEQRYCTLQQANKDLFHCTPARLVICDRHSDRQSSHLISPFLPIHNIRTSEMPPACPPQASRLHKTSRPSSQKPVQKGVSIDSLKNLAQQIQEKFKWNHEPRDFQLEAVKAQLQRRDVLVHAGTGSGKTFIAAGPHAHEAAVKKVTFLVSPLIALQDEQVRHSREIGIY